MQQVQYSTGLTNNFFVKGFFFPSPVCLYLSRARQFVCGCRRHVSSPQALVPRHCALGPRSSRDQDAQDPVWRVAPPEGPFDSRRQTMAQHEVVRHLTDTVLRGGFTLLVHGPSAPPAEQYRAPVDDVSSHHDEAAHDSTPNLYILDGVARRRLRRTPPSRAPLSAVKGSHVLTFVRILIFIQEDAKGGTGQQR